MKRAIVLSLALLTMVFGVFLVRRLVNEPQSDAVRRALECIERGDQIISPTVYIPIYMARFDVRVVEVSKYKHLLPAAVLRQLRESTTVEISDSKTGYRWICFFPEMPTNQHFDAAYYRGYYRVR